jgi:hypothetical protein
MKFLISFTNLICFLFITTIFTVLFFRDDGTCEMVADSKTCNARQSFLNVRNLCRFNPPNEYCMFITPLSDFFTVLMYTLVTSTVVVPLRKACEYMICKLFHNPVRVKKKGRGKNDKPKTGHKNSKQGAIVPVDGELSDVVHDMDDMRMDEFMTKEEKMENLAERLRGDEFKDAQSLRSTLMRAARLDKAQKSMDYVLPNEETALIMLQADADMQRYKNHMIFKNAVDNFSFRQMRYGFIKARSKDIRVRTGSTTSTKTTIPI